MQRGVSAENKIAGTPGLSEFPGRHESGHFETDHPPKDHNKEVLVK